MDNLQSQIEERINVMVGEVMLLVRRAATEAVSKALSGTGAISARAARPSGSRRSPRPAVAQSRRTPAELAELGERLYQAIAEAPGEPMVLYAKKLGLSVRELSLPVQHLRKSERVRTVGERDRMRYFPMGSA